MPAHNYAPIAHEDEIFSPSYNTGIPSTAPPSFHSVALSNRRPSFQLPHRNDESAATIMPLPMYERARNRPPMPASLAGDDSAYPVSIWAPSTSGSELGIELEGAREDVVTRLVERLEELERRLVERGEIGVEEEIRTAARWSRGDYLGVVAAVLLMIWICATITLAVAAKYRAAGHQE